MPFHFRAWEPTRWFGDPKATAEGFGQVLERLEVSGFPVPAEDLIFEVIDLRPREAPSEEVDSFARTVAGLFLTNGKERDTLEERSRLLFAGQARSLTDWESETSSRSINKDVELFIRAAQRLAVGHYVCVSPEPPQAVRGACPTDAAGAAWITSALFAFARYYSMPENARTDAVKALDGLTGDIAALFKSAQRRKGFERLGVPGNYRKAPGRRDDRKLLDEIRLLYQLGKRDRLSPYSPDRELEGDNRLTVELDLPSTSYELLGRIEEQVAPWASRYEICKGGPPNHPMGAVGDATAAQWLAGATFKMKRYEMLRDIGRLIGSNTIASLKEEIEKARPATSPLFLIIDDFIHYRLQQRARTDDNDHNVVEGLKRVFGLVGCSADDFAVVPTCAVRCDRDRLGGDARRRILDTGVQPCTLDGKDAEALKRPEDYAAILIDPEATSDALGPVRVQRLANYLRGIRSHTAREPDGASPVKVPAIIAFSQRESSGHVQQCLNLGAAAFTAKHRPYHLLFDLTRALRDAPVDRPSTNKASQFRILRSLKPHTLAKLRRDRGPAFFHGGFYCPRTDDPPSLDDFLDDPREEGWIRSLPKADLHCHIGTCIDHATVELMALNTVGYMLASGRSVAPEREQGARTADGAEPLLEKIARILCLAADLEKSSSASSTDRERPALLRLAAAAAAVVPRPLESKPFGMGDAVIEHLRSVDERCALFQVTGALVAMISIFPRRTGGAPPFAAPGGAIEYLAGLSQAASTPSDPAAAVEFSPTAALHHALERTMNRVTEIAHRWDGRFTERQIRGVTRRQTGEVKRPAERHAVADLDLMISELLSRTREAERVLKHLLAKAQAESDGDPVYARQLKDALKWLDESEAEPVLRLPPAPNAHPLEAYVLAARAPERTGRRSGLQLYLQGADLLGSAHLQYPDNLLLATYAVTRDNARDNIIYSEVRCETTGYTKGGMSAVDATEMLRHGFNVASLFLAGRKAPCDDANAQGGSAREAPRAPLVRTNILLAAKRHKNQEEARKVVALLESYLERRPGDVELALSRLRFPQPFPSWWRPSEVVGFDISGDESRDQDWLSDVTAPLAARSSPITIHAGEAADAQSIWRAVYRLNATRIGHGLRLNEDQALLSYCVREGICMEMCPNSNAATNGFRCIPAFDESPYPLLQYEYPLLHYMRAGMEVSLGSDNRYLHAFGRRNLTSEYVAAARLVGGLTRWEVLQIVKAGFKNAFLTKVEISEMLRTVEESIYSLVAADAS